jgi:ElaB/YqjD/DUF883 family membrane-anchored ribosome-binding protein
MEDQDLIRKQMVDTRTALSDKLEALEQKVADTVQPVTDAVERTTEAVAQTAENVKESVKAVTEKVEETVKSVASAFDLRRHAERHPWLVLGVAATSGCLIGTILARRSRPQQEAHTRSKHHAKGSNGASHHPEWSAARRLREKEQPAKQSLFAEEIRTLKGLAISSLLGFVRDLAKRAMPGSIGERIAEEVDSLTTRMGAQPLKSPVIADSEEKDFSQEAVTADSKTQFGSQAHRMRTGGGIDPGLS